MKLAVELGHERVPPGVALTGHVLVVEGGEARSLALTVRFLECSPAFRVPALEERAVLREGDLATGESVPFSIGLPDGAPPTARGRRCELLWELEVVADRSGPDAVVRRAFEVALDA